jgi:hypothetical protein
MVEKDPEERIEIDAERFRAFYAIFDDGRTGRGGEKQERINGPLRERLGQPPKGDNWLAGKSVLESWKLGTAKPTPRERKVLQAVYGEWRHDISVSQEFRDRIVVERNVAELLEVEGVTLEQDGLGPLMLKMKRLELFSKVRDIKDDNGKPLGQTAKLGFSEVTLAVEFPEGFNSGNEGTNSYKITLLLLISGQPLQSGNALGMDVRVEHERPAWRIFAAPMIDGRLTEAQLIDLFDRSVDEIVVRVEVAKADFNPVVYLKKPTGDHKKDVDAEEKAKQKLQGQILQQRLKNTDDRYILASGRVARK